MCDVYLLEEGYSFGPPFKELFTQYFHHGGMPYYMNEIWLLTSAWLSIDLTKIKHTKKSFIFKSMLPVKGINSELKWLVEV